MDQPCDSPHRSLGQLNEGRQNWAIALIAIFAIVIRLAPSWFHQSMDFAVYPPPNDSIHYLQAADGLQHGCGFARLSDGVCQKAEVLRTPAYPLMLAALPGVRAAIAAQCVMAGIMCALMALWVRRRWNVTAALVAEAIFACDMPSYTAANVIMSDALFQFLLFLAVMPVLIVATGEDRRLKSWAWTIPAAVAAGLAIMTRPIGLLLPVVMGVPFLFAPRFSVRRRCTFGAVALLIPTLVMGGWIGRNYRVAHFLGLSTVSAINLYFYVAANVVARETGASLEQVQRSFGESLGVKWPHIFDPAVQSPELTQRMMQLGESIMRDHPRQVLLMTLQTTIYVSIFPDRSALARVLGTAGGYSDFRVGLVSGAPSASKFRDEIQRLFQSPLLTILMIFQMVLIIFMWFGVGRALLRSLGGGSDYRLWVLYLTATAMLFILLAGVGGGMGVRLRTPAVPFLAIVAALGYFPKMERAVYETGRAPAEAA
jgi:hypothetical protein